MGTIIAMGGGGFSMEPENPLLDRYVLERTGKARPKVCFVPTAGGDSADYIARFEQAMTLLEAQPAVLSLFRPQTLDLEGFLHDQDVIYVGGGNTRNLLVLWKEWGLDRILRHVWEEGKVLCGVSAGAICWFGFGVTDSWGDLRGLRCLGFVPGSACPHFDGEPGRRPTYAQLVREGRLPGGYGIDDGAAVVFDGTDVSEVVCSRPSATAWRVRKQADDVTIDRLPARYLGSS